MDEAKKNTSVMLDASGLELFREYTMVRLGIEAVCTPDREQDMTEGLAVVEASRAFGQHLLESLEHYRLATKQETYCRIYWTGQPPARTSTNRRVNMGNAFVGEMVESLINLGITYRSNTSPEDRLMAFTNALSGTLSGCTPLEVSLVKMVMLGKDYFSDAAV